jgi:hypothetical protein
LSGSFLAPADVSLDGVISCRRIEVPEWIALGLELAGDAIHVLAWLEEFP